MRLSFGMGVGNGRLLRLGKSDAEFAATCGFFNYANYRLKYKYFCPEFLGAKIKNSVFSLRAGYLSHRSVCWCDRGIRCALQRGGSRKATSLGALFTILLGWSLFYAKRLSIVQYCPLTTESTVLFFQEGVRGCSYRSDSLCQYVLY